MRLCVIDGRGGGIGRRLVQELRCGGLDPSHEIIALGTNAAAAAAMLHAGATHVSIGEQAIVRIVPTVDVILASLNVILPGAMLGEVTFGIAHAVLKAPGRKLLLPLNRERVEVVGAEDRTLESLIGHTLQRVRTLLQTAVSV
ncbi:MAG: DUF3842 family protein [Nitrospiraceae bacterium]